MIKYYMVTAKFGHVGKNNYYKGTLFVYAKSKKEAAKIVRNKPRVKHDRKDAILEVKEISPFMYNIGNELNESIHYYSCENIQEQRMYIDEIENNIYEEESDEIVELKQKKHSLRKNYNEDPEFDYYKSHKVYDIA